MTSKGSRRRVTVDSKTLPEGEGGKRNKLSVFERLGPGAPNRGYEPPPPPPPPSEYNRPCHNWQKTGHCPYGTKCKFQHTPRREGAHGTHARRSRQDSDSDSTSLTSPEQSPPEALPLAAPRGAGSSSSKRDKDKVKSAVVISKPSYGDSGDGSDWEDEDEMALLMRKRKELQKQLELEAMDSHSRRPSSEDEVPLPVPPVKEKKEKNKQLSPPRIEMEPIIITKKKNKEKKKKKKNKMHSPPPPEPIEEKHEKRRQDIFPEKIKRSAEKRMKSPPEIVAVKKPPPMRLYSRSPSPLTDSSRSRSRSPSVVAKKKKKSPKRRKKSTERPPPVEPERQPPPRSWSKSPPQEKLKRSKHRLSMEAPVVVQRGERMAVHVEKERVQKLPPLSPVKLKDKHGRNDGPSKYIVKEKEVVKRSRTPEKTQPRYSAQGKRGSSFDSVSSSSSDGVDRDRRSGHKVNKKGRGEKHKPVVVEGKKSRKQSFSPPAPPRKRHGSIDVVEKAGRNRGHVEKVAQEAQGRPDRSVERVERKGKRRGSPQPPMRSGRVEAASPQRSSRATSPAEKETRRAVRGESPARPEREGHGQKGRAERVRERERERDQNRGGSLDRVEGRRRGEEVARGGKEIGRGAKERAVSPREARGRQVTPPTKVLAAEPPKARGREGREARIVVETERDRGRPGYEQRQERSERERGNDREQPSGRYAEERFRPDQERGVEGRPEVYSRHSEAGQVRPPPKGDNSGRERNRGGEYAVQPPPATERPDLDRYGREIRYQQPKTDERETRRGVDRFVPDPPFFEGQPGRGRTVEEPERRRVQQESSRGRAVEEPVRGRVVEEPSRGRVVVEEPSRGRVVEEPGRGRNDGPKKREGFDERYVKCREDSSPQKAGETLTIQVEFDPRKQARNNSSPRKGAPQAGRVRSQERVNKSGNKKGAREPFDEGRERLSRRQGWEQQKQPERERWIRAEDGSRKRVYEEEATHSPKRRRDESPAGSVHSHGSRVEKDRLERERLERERHERERQVETDGRRTREQQRPRHEEGVERRPEELMPRQDREVPDRDRRPWEEWHREEALRRGEEPPRRGEELPRRGEEPPRRGEELSRRGEEPPRRGEEPTRRGEEPPRRGEEPPRRGEDPLRRGEEPPRRGEEPPRRGEEPPRRGEEPPRRGEEPPRRGEEPPRRGEEPPRRGEEPPRRGEELIRRGEEVARKADEPLRRGEEPGRRRDEAGRREEGLRGRRPEDPPRRGEEQRHLDVEAERPKRDEGRSRSQVSRQKPDVKRRRSQSRDEGDRKRPRREDHTTGGRDEMFSDWSDNDDDLLIPPMEEARRAEVPKLLLPPGEDRVKRSPSRSSIGSRHSHQRPDDPRYLDGRRKEAHHGDERREVADVGFRDERMLPPLMERGHVMPDAAWVQERERKEWEAKRGYRGEEERGREPHGPRGEMLLPMHWEQERERERGMRDQPREFDGREMRGGREDMQRERGGGRGEREWDRGMERERGDRRKDRDMDRRRDYGDRGRDDLMYPHDERFRGDDFRHDRGRDGGRGHRDDDRFAQERLLEPTPLFAIGKDGLPIPPLFPRLGDLGGVGIQNLLPKSLVDSNIPIPPGFMVPPPPELVMMMSGLAPPIMPLIPSLDPNLSHPSLPIPQHLLHPVPLDPSLVSPAQKDEEGKEQLTEANEEEVVEEKEEMGTEEVVEEKREDVVKEKDEEEAAVAEDEEAETEEAESQTAATGEDKAQAVVYDDILSDDDIDEILNQDADVTSEENEEKTANNILDIDWSTVKTATQPLRKGTHSALKRFTAASIFSRIGISRAYAGDALVAKVTDLCQKQLDEDTEEKDKKPTKGGIMPKKEAPRFELLHDVAELHASAVIKNKERATLLSNMGPLRGGLCARRDLAIRRKLCKVEVDVDSLHLYGPHMVDMDLYKQAIQLLPPLDRSSVERRSQTRQTTPQPLSVQ